MAYFYRLHPEADQDITDAYKWYEDKSEGLGDKFLYNIRKRIEEVAQQPQTFSSKGRKGFREAIADKFPYIIVYKIYEDKNEIVITSVHHAKKHPKHKYRK